MYLPSFSCSLDFLKGLHPSFFHKFHCSSRCTMCWIDLANLSPFEGVSCIRRRIFSEAVSIQFLCSSLRTSASLEANKASIEDDTLWIIVDKTSSSPLELDGRFQVLKQDHVLNQDVAPEVGIAQLKLQQVLMGQELREELVGKHLLLPRVVWRFLSQGPIQLETGEGVQDVVGILEYKVNVIRFCICWDSWEADGSIPWWKPSTWVWSSTGWESGRNPAAPKTCGRGRSRCQN